MEALLTVKNLSVSFSNTQGKVTVVSDSSFQIQKGEVVGLVGESGCGKSVTAMSILRLLPTPPGNYDTGEILFQDKNLLKLPIAELNKIRGRHIGMIFQEPMTALSPLRKIGSQMIEALQTHYQLTKQQAQEKSLEWLKNVGMPDPEQKLNCYPYELSGGMRQRVMIAMAQMLEPDLLIADEPTTALDVTIQSQVFDLMRKVRGNKASMLLITHDMGVIWENCDRVLVMYASQIVEEGTVKEIFSNPKHPYTQGLLNAIPRMDVKKERMNTIPGNVPPPNAYPIGCHFANRCPYVFDRCLKEKPSLKEVGELHYSRCFLEDKKDGK